jgi:hypothetical protein
LPGLGQRWISDNIGQNLAHCSDVLKAPLTCGDIELTEGH